MTIHKYKLPDPGEGLLEAEIVEWKVSVGDTVSVNQIVVEVETAKSLVELPIPWAGTVTEILVKVGDEVAVGTDIIAIDDGTGGGVAPAADGGEASGATTSEGDGEEQPKLLVGSGPKHEGTTRRRRKAPMIISSPSGTGRDGAAPAAADDIRGEEVPHMDRRVPERTTPAHRDHSAADHIHEQTSRAVERSGRPLAKPPVRKLAKDLGVDLAQVTGSGEGGIITREDVTAYAEGQPSAAAASAPQAQAPARGGAAPAGAEQAAYGMETRTPIKGVRKVTAAAMTASAFTAPHVTEWVTVDCTATMELVERLKADREFKDVKVTPLLVLAKAMCVAVRRNPGINAEWDEAAQEIVTKHYVNLGIAAATPRGLLVPNIKHADSMTMRELAEAIGDLVSTAREGRTQPADMAGGTITITNIGVFGVDTGTPILNPGESAIMAFGAIRRQPWVVTGPDGTESIEPRWVTQLALSFDHRLVDGELGSKYLADVGRILEDPARGLVWG